MATTTTSTDGRRANGHQRVEHAFAHDELSYDADRKVEGCVKASFFFRKLPDVSYEHFEKHWSTVHADLTVAGKPFSEYNCIRYVQQSMPPDVRARLERIGQHPMPFDGCSIIWFRTWDDYERFFSQHAYTAVADDCRHFMDRSSLTVYAGHDLIIFGKGIPGVDENDGIQVPNTRE
ncbi:Dimeric alpha-beta barrel [Niveomyces insectorum RCEF 264]|uniref:Dimeric alpha-beta barrel n=1 Tax=Niveomyces insectorum RCEF 264 TaxID=1081102 RepID=A0A167WA28_9HYPO|nr:Dimeric alpha-beta barrel [Niveomyces insectorum RCEF 264]